MIEDHRENTAPSGADDAEGGASFGFREVSPTEKTALVRGVFDSVATRYDVMNDAMSGGVHRIWKSAMIDWLRPRPGMRMLDVAGGTGDIAFRILDKANREVPASRTPATVTVCDINEAMLNVGRDRAVNAGRFDNLDWMVGNAEALPFADAAYDAYTIAFGIRNVTDIPAALKEAHRVLKFGGRFFCLEFSTTEWPGFGEIYDVYSEKLVPRIGQAVAGDADSYRYLIESIRRFPKMPEFAAMIEAAGFKNVKYRPILGGAVAIHSGWKI